MGVSILWEPMDRGQALVVGLRSAFVQVLSRLFGPSPWGLDGFAREALRGVGETERDFREACQTLIRAIEEHGRIRVWTE